MIKARTNLHQTIMNRCLKMLEQKQLVKAVKSVKFPTRKIFMLYDLTPSIELSGGPWYTDNELDTGFIHELSMACLRYIQSKTWPKDGRSSALYPASHTEHLPTVAHVHQYLKEARLTDTDLEPEHVVALLDLLIYDREVEKIPVLPTVSSRIRHAPMSDGSDSDPTESTRRGSSRHRKRARSTVQEGSGSDSAGSDSEPLPSPRASAPQAGDREQGVELVPSDDDAASELTHVPYVYRAMKHTLQPHGGAQTSYIPLSASWLQTPTAASEVEEVAKSAEVFFGVSADAKRGVQGEGAVV